MRQPSPGTPGHMRDESFLQFNIFPSLFHLGALETRKGQQLTLLQPTTNYSILSYRSREGNPH